MRRKRRNEEEFHFEGFSSPNTTPVPDEFFDVLAPRLSEAELRVLLYIIRRTFGFKKQADAISLKQLVEGIRTKDGTVLDTGTGMSKRGVLLGVSGLVNKGIIEVQRRMSEDGKHEINVYSLRFRELSGENPNASNASDDKMEGIPRVGYDGDYRSHPGIPPVGYHGDIQETVLQETVLQTTTTSPPPQEHVVVASQPPNHPRVVPRTDRQQEISEKQKQLVQQLRDLGVHPKTADKIVRDRGESIEELIRFVVWKLEHGWQPDVSAAAWIVAAVRDGYEVPEAFRQSQRAAEDQQHRREEAEREIERMQHELERARAERLRRLGVSKHDEELWRQVLERLKVEGKWRPVLAAAVMRSGGAGRYEIVVPWKQVQTRVRECMGVIRQVLSEIVADGRVVVEVIVERSTESG